MQIEPRSVRALARNKAATVRERDGHRACALAVGGLDPGGGAGVLADLRAFERAGAFGCAAVAVTTIQSVAGLRSVRAESARELSAEIAEVLDHQRVRAIKVGALGSRENVRALCREVRRRRNIPVVVDTPMLPTRGRARLTEARALGDLMDDLMPLATLLTVNVDEARAFLGGGARASIDPHEAAIALGRAGGAAVLVKGGHLDGPLATDFFAIDGEVIEIQSPRLKVGAVHGTGCTFASLIAGRLACVGAGGLPDRAGLVAAVRWAKRVHHAALARALRVGPGMRVLTFER